MAARCRRIGRRRHIGSRPVLVSSTRKNSRPIKTPLEIEFRSASWKPDSIRIKSPALSDCAANRIPTSKSPQAVSRREKLLAQLCREFEISRPMGYVWIKRYRKQGTAGLEEHSRRPQHSPRQTAEGFRTASDPDEEPLAGLGSLNFL